MLLILIPLTVSVAQADGVICPKTLLSVRWNDLYHHLGGELAIPAAVYDSTFVLGNGQAHITFDHNLSTLTSSISSGGWFTASVRVVERFDLAGVAPGTSVNALLAYDVDGWAQNCGLISCGVYYWASLVCGSDSVTVNASQNGPADLRTYMFTTLTLPVTLTAGSPVDITFSLNYWTPRFADDIQAQGSGHYSVRGLPTGVRAVTCSGPDATPVRRRSWGSFKLGYR